MPVLIFKFVLGLILLLVSTKYLVKLAEKISSSFRISPLVVGLTIVAIGTSLPELAVSSIASSNNDQGLAMGNIIGSNIVNILLVFAVGIIFADLRIGTTKTQRNILLMFGVTTLFTLLHSLPVNHIFLGIFLISLSIFLTLLEYRWAIAGRAHEDLVSLNNRIQEKATFERIPALALCIAGVIIGGYLIVISIENLSLLTGYSTTILGLTLTAIVTSLPELMTTIFSEKAGEEKLTIGNIIGSNIYNLLFIGGVISLLSPSVAVPLKDWILLIFISLLFVLIVKFYQGKIVPKWIGFTLLINFIAYLLFLGI